MSTQISTETNHLYAFWMEVDPRTNRAIVMAATDNLVKGASGAVVQNLNLMFGYDETAGLMNPGLMP